MKRFKHSNQKGLEARLDLLRQVQQLMASGEGNHATFDRVNVDGSNTGAVMCVNPSISTGVPDSCGINIYISNNIQGVNNSILVGSEVKMGEAGLKLSFGDVKWDMERQKSKAGLSRGLPRSWLAAILLCAVAALVSVFAAQKIVNT